ncbi:hypothetical protein LWP59_30670 [Amycolatopsis acidiphila]|uniref:Uncharacterized protein n=1 Tax=Amycolatopsis acidiphila TaxID=715473 RepID=A0A558A1T7_9PSEU|nr:hypothetical protein [Amycolatopsis acidiphila]TVT18218.1 hypothetical protein FNH06_28480 [Amycolatopsis acidiphila]UIJ58442.1 hypothetical protein LWP59_30670 [Amycolatopsis acidiphila]GHG93263.1 hypothetical protein GCM10017788_70440 [Amycolatopsis acidiphila]
MHDLEAPGSSMIVDCGRCVARGIGCADCAVSVLLNAPPTVEWDPDELRAIEALAEGGLIPRLRLAPMTGREQDRAA